MSPRSRVAAAASLLIVVVSGCSLDGQRIPPVQSDQTASPSPTLSVQQVLDATRASGDARLSIRVEARMPSDFDDGVPRRSFTGKGFWDQERDVAGVNFKMSKVPNAAGYFGQVDGTMSVFYMGSGFRLSFPVLVEALRGRGEWFNYELADFSEPKIRELGIGQLREIGLSDPRLVLALLRGAPGGLSGGQPATIGGMRATSYALTVQVAEAGSAAPLALQPQFQALQDLGVQQVQLQVGLDSRNRVLGVVYDVEYPPAPGSRTVRLEVGIHLEKFGLEGGLTPPPKRKVLDYSDYVAR